MRAITSGHPYAAPDGWLELGRMRNCTDDEHGKHFALRKAAESDNPDAGPRTALLLGVALRRSGDAAGAKAAFELAATFPGKFHISSTRARNSFPAFLFAVPVRPADFRVGPLSTMAAGPQVEWQAHREHLRVGNRRGID
jgi:hypothetical protein